MTAKQAKEASFYVKPPEQPPAELIEAIAFATTRGERKAMIRWPISEQQEWWLEESGYTINKIESVMACSVSTVISVEW